MGFPDRLRITDVPLDAAHANAAAAIHEQARVSVADAHIGDISRIAGDRAITVVTI